MVQETLALWVAIAVAGPALRRLSAEIQLWLAHLLNAEEIQICLRHKLADRPYLLLESKLAFYSAAGPDSLLEIQ
jgi:hypothetical protein